MKQIPKEKDNYKKFSFLFPVLYSTFNAVMIIASYTMAKQGLTQVNGSLASNIALFTMGLMAVSPALLILTVFISMRHRNRYPNGSYFYRQAPMGLSFLVIGGEVLYMALLAMG